jgi:hypothetical protein
MTLDRDGGRPDLSGVRFSLSARRDCGGGRDRRGLPRGFIARCFILNPHRANRDAA